MSEVLSHRELRTVNGRLSSLAETRFDKVMSSQITLLLSLSLLVMALFAVWMCRPVSDSASQQFQAGGLVSADSPQADSSLLDVVSPQVDQADRSLINDQVEVDLTQLTDHVALMADSASQVATVSESLGDRESGVPDAAEGSGGQPFGQGASNRSGLPREQRWLIEYSEQADLKSYAAMLTSFNIEIAAVYSDGRLVYLAQPGAESRIVQSSVGTDDQRLMMSWADGGRRVADLALLESAGVDDADKALVVHFFPEEVEQQLKRLELEFGGHSESIIRRTLFSVRRSGGGFEFFVVRQELRK